MTGLGESYSTAVDAIYAAASTPERWPECLTLVADHLGLTGGLVAFHPPPPHAPFTVVGRLRDDLTRLYLRDHVVNPVAAALAKVPSGVPFMTDTLVDMAAVRRSAFHADILAPQNIDTQIAFSHPSLCLPGGSGGIAFMLSTRQSDNRAAIQRRLRPLVAHLTRAVDISLSIGRQLKHNAQLERVLALMPAPAMLLDSQGCISFANPAAEALLIEADGLTVSRAGRHLDTAHSGDQRHLAQAIRTSVLLARGLHSDWVGTVRVTRPSGRPRLIVLATPLPAPFHPFGPAMPSRAAVLIQVLGNDGGRSKGAKALQQLYGLTPAETRVATLIGGGLSAPATAQALGVSVTTVKSHLGRCFDKLEVRSQADLTRLVAQLPADVALADATGPPSIGGRAPPSGPGILRA